MLSDGGNLFSYPLQSFTKGQSPPQQRKRRFELKLIPSAILPRDSAEGVPELLKMLRVILRGV